MGGPVWVTGSVLAGLSWLEGLTGDGWNFSRRVCVWVVVVGARLLQAAALAVRLPCCGEGFG